MGLRDETRTHQFSMIRKGLNVLVKDLTHKRFKWDMIRTINQCKTIKDLQLCRDVTNQVLQWERRLC